MSNETWKYVNGTTEYMVSNVGRIKSLKYDKERMLIPVLHPNGYYRISISKNGTSKLFLLHRLVAIAFLQNKKNHKCVNHKNGVKTDNSVENLEWCSYSENIKHAFEKLGKISVNKGRFGSESYTAKPIRQVDINTGEVIAVYPSIIEASNNIKTNSNHISCAAKGKRKSCAGYKWEYI